MSNKCFELPILPLRDPDIVVFPGTHVEIEVGRPVSTKAISISQQNYKNKFVVAFQKIPDKDDPESSDFHNICCEAEIRSIVKLPDRVKIIVVGIRRAILKSVTLPTIDNNFYMGNIEHVLENEAIVDERLVEVVRTIRDIILEKIPTILVNQEIPQNVSNYLDSIASQLPIRGRSRLSILRLSDVNERAEALLKMVSQIAKNSAVGYSTTKSNKDGGDEPQTEMDKLRKMIDDAQLTEEALKVANSEFRRLLMMPQGGGEFQVAYNYIETIASLPWSKFTEDKIDVSEARKFLDEDHFGLEKVKERILEFLAIRKLAPDHRGSILCFAGPPGTGKTSCGKAIAKAMGRKFIRMSLGGVNDEAEIRGHRRTYIGAMPGKIIQMLRKAESNNPVFMLDEVDKLCSNFRGDPAASLLEVLDPEQNFSFMDNYLSIPFNLSNVMFVATVNDLGAVPAALRDRMEIIDISGYTMFDKLNIAQKHLIRKKKEENGLKDYEITITDDAIQRVIEEYTSEAGVRSLERYCGTILRKMAVRVASGENAFPEINTNMIPELLGPPKVLAERMSETPLVGVSTGLAWSTSGGSILFVETCLTPGEGKVELTGNLGKVMLESAKAVYTWIKTNATDLGLDIEVIRKKDVHIHFPAGGTPKDGPSAGIAVAASMLSAFLNKPVRNDVAMTGEISLRGRVLPIGGLREKVMAAHRAGIKQVIYPTKNECDLEDIPPQIREDMKLIPMSDLFEALSILIIEGTEESGSGIGSCSSELLANRGR